MKYQLNHRRSIHKLGILALIGLVILAWVFPVVAEYSAENDPMMRRLFALHSKLANNGNMESVVKLGGMFERGEGIAKDHEKAIQLYKYAADQGNEFAIGLLAKPRTGTSTNANQDDILSIKVPNSPNSQNKIIEDEETQRQQQALELKLQQEKASAEAARTELENLKRQQQQELASQQRLKAEIEKVQKAQEQIARERAKVDAYRQEMEIAQQKHEEELKKQAELSKIQQAEATKSSSDIPASEQKDSEQSNFSSNPCNTPVAKFMSTCN